MIKTKDHDILAVGMGKTWLLIPVSFPGHFNDAASIGRVVTAPKYRKTGAGHKLMIESIGKTFSQFNCTEIRISTQVYLTKFYQSLGFLQSSEEYLEDGIPHIEMTLTK